MELWVFNKVKKVSGFPLFKNGIRVVKQIVLKVKKKKKLNVFLVTPWQDVTQYTKLRFKFSKHCSTLTGFNFLE